MTGDRLTVHRWDDPHGNHLPDSTYVEALWLPTIGPSTLVLYRRLTTWLHHSPVDAIDVDVAELGQLLGIKTERADASLHRLAMFGLARHLIVDGRPGIEVRTLAPDLPARLAARLPALWILAALDKAGYRITRHPEAPAVAVDRFALAGRIDTVLGRYFNLTIDLVGGSTTAIHIQRAGLADEIAAVVTHTDDEAVSPPNPMPHKWITDGLAITTSQPIGVAEMAWIKARYALGHQRGEIDGIHWTVRPVTPGESA